MALYSQYKKDQRVDALIVKHGLDPIAPNVRAALSDAHSEITPEMVRAGIEQSRVDGSLCLNVNQRIERVLRAALTGTVDRALFEADLDRRRADPTLTA